MKKVFISIILAAVCSTGFAQLIVQSDGKVLTNCTPNVTALSDLSIGGAGNTSYQVGITSGTKNCVWVGKPAQKTGIAISSVYGTMPYSTDIALNIFPSGGQAEFMTSTYGINCYSGLGTYYNYGVCGKYFSIAGPSPTAAAGIYGSSTTSDTFAYSGIYAGYFNGDVRVTGTIYGTLLTPSSNSNGNNGESGSQTARSMTDIYDESVSEKLQQVQLLQITNRSKSASNHKKAYSVSYPLGEDETPLTEEEFKKLVEEHQDDEPIQTKMADTRYGLAADQLKAVYPELVYEDEQGNVSINYMEMIPLLVQALNEQQARIDALEGKNNPTMKAKGNATDVETAEADILAMAQNVPNPFSESTEIELNIPASVKTAAVFFYDMTGKQVDKRVITDRGATTLSVSGTDLTEGMYLYSLIADGKVISTKKMILTK